MAFPDEDIQQETIQLAFTDIAISNYFMLFTDKHIPLNRSFSDRNNSEKWHLIQYDIQNESQ